MQHDRERLLEIISERDKAHAVARGAYRSALWTYNDHLSEAGRTLDAALKEANEKFSKAVDDLQKQAAT